METKFKEISCIGNCVCSSEKRWIVYTTDLLEELQLLEPEGDQLDWADVYSIIKELKEQRKANSTIKQKSHGLD